MSLQRDLQQYVPSREEQQAILTGETDLVLTREQAAWGMEEFFQKILRLHRAKNQDYAAKDDGLHNFRETARRLNLTLPQVFMTLIEKHLLAMENDAQNPNLALNEGVVDRLHDIACYAGLFYLALRERTLKQRKGWSGARTP